MNFKMRTLGMQKLENNAFLLTTDFRQHFSFWQKLILAEFSQVIEMKSKNKTSVSAEKNQRGLLMLTKYIKNAR